MTDSLCQLFEKNPVRPKNWRFILLHTLRDQKIELTDVKLHPKMTKVGKMLRQIESFGATGPNVLDYLNILNDYGTLFTAYSIYTDNRHTNARHMIEALAIIDTPIEKIAERLRFEAEIIEWFEYLFFDIRTRIGVAGYVQQELLGNKFGQGVSAFDTDVYWKMIALSGGIDLLDLIWSGTTLNETQILTMRKVLQSRLYSDSVKAMHVRRPADHNASEILNDLVTVNKELAPRVGAENELEEAAKDIIESVSPSQRDWNAPYSGYESTLYANQEQEKIDAPAGFIRDETSAAAKPSSP